MNIAYRHTKNETIANNKMLLVVYQEIDRISFSLLAFFMANPLASLSK